MASSSQYGYAPPPPPPLAHASAPTTQVTNTPPDPLSPVRGTVQVQSALRRRVHPTPPLPTITTSLQSTPAASLLAVHSAVTPSSASTAPSLGVPFSPYAAPTTPLTATVTSPPVLPSSMATRAAQTVVAPYNPSEWNRSGPVTGAYVPYQASPPAQIRTTEVTGMEGTSRGAA